MAGPASGNKSFFSYQNQCPWLTQAMHQLSVCISQTERICSEPTAAIRAQSLLRTPPPYSVPSLDTDRSLYRRVTLGACLPRATTSPRSHVWAKRSHACRHSGQSAASGTAGICWTIENRAPRFATCSCQANAQMSLYFCNSPRFRQVAKSKFWNVRSINCGSCEKCSESNYFFGLGFEAKCLISGMTKTNASFC